MVLNLCKHYGRKMGSVNGLDIFSFPDPASLAADGVENHLRELGFGYRAGYITKSAAFLADNPEFITSIQNSESIRESLMILSGVGPKVADCISLMSFNQLV